MGEWTNQETYPGPWGNVDAINRRTKKQQNVNQFYLGTCPWSRNNILF
jgi:hypothetical protein